MLTMTTKGLYCEAGGFHIDASRAVRVSLTTHAHSDHARQGCGQYVCAASSARLLARRVGLEANIRAVPYRETLDFNGVKVSFHPAGHILGSSQIRLEYRGEVWVVSGDYKRDPDPTCEPFEVLKCDTFLTEATFGHPRYEWNAISPPAAEIFDWWEQNRSQGRNSLLFCYALGKTQRVLAELLAYTDREVLLFGEAGDLTEIYRAEGVRMVSTRRLETLPSKEKVQRALIVAGHSILRSGWMSRLGEAETAFASGWMQSGAFGFYRSYDRGFVLSDHADFPSLVRTVEETGASRVYVLHAREGKGLIRHLRQKGIEARPAESLSDAQIELPLGKSR